MEGMGIKIYIILAVYCVGVVGTFGVDGGGASGS
jgi:hypothetical protein